MAKQLYIALLALIMVLTSCSEYQKVVKSENLDEKFDAAMKYFDDGDYYRAGTLFEELIPLYIGRKEAEISQFKYAYCHYHQDQLYLASYYFDRFLTTYPRSDKAEEAAFMKCMSLYYITPASNLEQKSTQEALDAIQIFTNQYPNSQYVEKANGLVDQLTAKIEKKEYDNAKLYEKLRYYKAAVIAYNNFISTYPGSKYVEEIYYNRVASQFELAEISVLDKQEERYDEALNYYQLYADKFGNGEYGKQAEAYYEKILSSKERMKNRRELFLYESAKTRFSQRNYPGVLNSCKSYFEDYKDPKHIEELLYYRSAAQLNVAKDEEGNVRKLKLEKAVQYTENYRTDFPTGKYLKKIDQVYDESLKELNMLESQ